MTCMFDFLNGQYVKPRGTYDLIIIKSDKMINIHIRSVHVKFH